MSYTTKEFQKLRQRRYLPIVKHYHETPLELVKGSGQHVWDSEGRRYLDAIGGVVCISAGHNHPRIKERLSKLLAEDALQHTSYLYLNATRAAATEALVEAAPPGLERMVFTNSGTEANELALMVARQKTRELTVVSLKHAYHGSSTQTLAHCGLGSWKFRSQPTMPALQVKPPYCYRCPFGKKPTTCALDCVQDLKETLATGTHGAIAAFIAEPILGAGGFITPSPEYFHEAYKIVKQAGGLYISDEVQTGNARTGTSYFYSEHLGLEPDILTTAKGLGNGAPVAATFFRDEVAEDMHGKTYFNTYGGDTLQAAQAHETLKIIREENLLENARERGEELRQGLEELSRHRHVGEVRGKGLLIGVELVRDKASKEYGSAEASFIMDHCQREGVLIGKGGLGGNVLRIAPPLCITADDVRQILTTLGQAFQLAEKNS